MKQYIPVSNKAAARIERLFRLASRLNLYVSNCGGESTRVAQELAAIRRETDHAAACLPEGVRMETIDRL